MMRPLMFAKVLLSAAAALPLAAATVAEVPGFPAPVWSGREVSLDVPLSGVAPAPGAGWHVFRIVMDFDATGSNNVQVAVGADAGPCDGALSPAETALAFGWDCGAWTLRPKGLKELHTSVPSDAQTARRRVLTAEFRVGRDGAPLSVRFSEEGSGPVVFGGLAPAPVPQWLEPASWTLLRATARGAAAADASVSAAYLADGVRVILK